MKSAFKNNIKVQYRGIIHRYCLLLFCLLGVASYAQDIESRFFALNDLSLPEVNIVAKSTFYRQYAKTSITDAFEVNTSNYWRPVDMLAAMSHTQSYIHRRPITSQREYTAESMGLVAPGSGKEPTIRFQIVPSGVYYRQRSYGIRNDAYQDMSLPVFNAHPRSRGYYPYY